MDMNKSEVIHVRVEPSIKEQTEAIFKKLGLNTTQAFSLFLNRVIMENGLPFDVKVQNSDEKLASVLSSLGGKGKVSKQREKIINLYSNGLIDYETACFAIKRSFNKQ